MKTLAVESPRGRAAAIARQKAGDRLPTWGDLAGQAKRIMEVRPSSEDIRNQGLYGENVRAETWGAKARLHFDDMRRDIAKLDKVLHEPLMKKFAAFL